MDQTQIRNIRLLRLFFGVCVGGSLFGATPTYKVTVIPLPPVTPYSAYPMGINNSGQVVGYVQHADSSESPFIATASGFTFIPLPPGVTQVVPTNINDSGQVTTLFSEYFGLSAPAI